MFKIFLLAVALTLIGCTGNVRTLQPPNSKADCVVAGTIPDDSPLISEKMIRHADEFAQSYCDPGDIEKCAESFVIYFMLAGKKKYGITPQETVAELEKNGEKYENLQDIEHWMIAEHNLRLETSCK